MLRPTGRRSGLTGPEVWVSSRIEPRAKTTPTAAGPLIRSPRARPAVTGTAAAAAAEDGATTDMTPQANAR